MTKERKIMQTRNIDTKMEIRNSEGKEKIIEGYFVVFNRETELFSRVYEEVDKDAFKNTLNADIRALVNHDTRLVLGRTKSNTLELKADSYGLYGKIRLNEDDTEAMNLYARVKRGDVDQCSFGFVINEEETIYRDDGTVKFIIKDVELHEVSVCTFPAYEDTSISARERQLEEMDERKIQIWKNKTKERIGLC